MTPAMTTGRTQPIAPAPASSLDEQLLTAYRSQGDRAALGRLVERHHEQAYRLALRLSGTTSDADDVLQEAVLALMSSAHQYRPTATGSVRSWYLAIVANAYRRRARAERRRSHREQDGPHHDRPAPDPVQGHWDEEVRLALGALAEHERLPILLRHGDDLAISDIAAALGRKQKTVRSQIERGLERLRTILSARCGLRSQAGIIAALSSACASRQAPSSQLLAELQERILTATVPVAAAGMGTGLTSLLIGGVLLATLGVAVTLHGRATPLQVQPSPRLRPPTPPTPPTPLTPQIPLAVTPGGTPVALPDVSAVVGATRNNAQGQQDLVLLTTGRDSKAQAGMEFIVYRGNQYIVKVRAENVMPGMIPCRVMPGSWNTSGLSISAGDLAVNRL